MNEWMTLLNRMQIFRERALVRKLQITRVNYFPPTQLYKKIFYSQILKNIFIKERREKNGKGVIVDTF